MLAPLIQAAQDFRGVLAQARKAAEPVHFQWYPYDSLGNIVHLSRLLDKSDFDLVSTIRGNTILDLGCADGDFAFFLESLGASVVAVDHPRGNHNNLAGITTLKRELRSKVEIRRMDLDARLNLPDKGFEFTFALGLLYHLKNPFQFLETISRSSRYCIISTRVMRRTPGVGDEISGVPLAYLLGADELNADKSNFWIFTEAALRRMVERAHWRVLAWTSVGDTKASLPHTMEHDERAFCLLESTWGDLGLELGEGWHEPEDTGWRWTAKDFTVRAGNTAGMTGITASLYVPDALIAAYGPVTLNVTVNGEAGEPETFTAPGLFQYDRMFSLATPDVEIRFSASHAFAPDQDDQRERSLIFESIELTR